MMNERLKSIARALALGTVLMGGVAGCVASTNEEAATPPPPPVDPSISKVTPRPAAPSVQISLQDQSDAGDLQHGGAAGAASSAPTPVTAASSASASSAPSAAPASSAGPASSATPSTRSPSSGTKGSPKH
jgi:hypothetical protein